MNSATSKTIFVLFVLLAFASFVSAEWWGSSLIRGTGSVVLESSEQASASSGTTAEKPTTPTGSSLLIIEYSDFQTPFGAKFAKDTLPQIRWEYGPRVEIVFRHFPLSFNQFAEKAAEASECARNQGKFWEYHDILYQKQEFLSKDALNRYAGYVGLDTEKFAQCLSSGEMAGQVKADFEEGTAKGVSGIPTFFIGTQVITGAQPFSAFKEAIDRALGVKKDEDIYESVNCIFSGSQETQKCYSDTGVSCYGVYDCSAKVAGEKGRQVIWKSPCEYGYQYTTMDGQGERVKFDCSTTPSVPGPTDTVPVEILYEQVKCVFNNSPNKVEECYSDYGSCSGNPACIVEVKGKAYTTIGWKSTCGGYAYTKIDGENDYAVFECTRPTTEPKEPAGPFVSEAVKCLFENSSEEQKCYEDSGVGTGCSGKERCSVNVKGEKGRRMIWKSSCGGYAYLVFDGENEYAKFDCTLVVAGEPKEPAKPGEKEPTKPGDYPSYCNEGDTRNYDCGNGTKVTWCSCIGGNWKCAEAPENACQQKQEPVCNGCVGGNGTCLQAGTRLLLESDAFPTSGDAYYCDSDTKFKLQKKDGETCQNNFECTTNTCSDGVCINLQAQIKETRNILQQLIDWLTSIFGFRQGK